MNSKLAKEEFVSGHSGTSLGEIYLLTSTIITGYLLRCVLIVCLSSNVRKSAVLTFLAEYATIILPGVLVFTVLADYTLYMLLFILTTAAIVMTQHLLRNKVNIVNGFHQLSSVIYPSRLPFVTLTRSYITLITTIAILAVDFHIFPRRLAKAETYGSGLMDVGVGAFIMSHGLTSPEVRDQGGVKLVMATMRGVLPLIVIGVLRVMAVKGTDYQEHVTEYGVHWNFFFTIAAVRVLASMLSHVFNSRPWLYGLGSLLTAVGYQLALSLLGLSHYIQHGPNGDGSRPTLLSANREGMWSTIGYLAIYLGHIQMGKWLFKPRKSLLDYLPVLCSLLSLSVVFYCVSVLASSYIEPISRRIVNLAYICWIFSYGAMILGLFLLTDFIVYTLSLSSRSPHPHLHTPHTTREPHKPSVCLVSAVDYNQLAVFLLANLLTGLVNLSMDTLSAGTVTALLVLSGYMALLAAVFSALFTLRFKIKF